MPEGQPITRELSLSEVISKTFHLYARDFVKYLILFVIIEAIIGVLITVLQRGIVLPIPPVNATPQETLALGFELSGSFGRTGCYYGTRHMGVLPYCLRDRSQVSV